MTKSKLLDELNKEQLQAVTHKNGPLLIIAGAGTGKTKVITHRIAWLIEQKLAKPSEILALTFTEKAAAEMEERVDVLVPYGFVDTWISTFHAFGDRIIRDYALELGLPANFKVLTQTQQAIFIHQNLYAFDLKYFRPISNPLSHIEALIKHFSRLKDELITPEDYLRFAQVKNEKLKIKSVEETVESEKTLELANAYQRYCELMIQAGNLDFGDQIFLAYKLLKENKKVLAECQEKFKYILVDEFQDTNYGQNELIKLLAAKNQNITVVGDDDQCLPSTTKIKTPKGDKLIKNLRINHEVITAIGKGHVGISKINKIFKNTRKRKLITVKTASGKILTVTDNHKMFSYVPNKENNNFYYVYLMYRQNLGWRLGITNDLITRLRLERSADKIIGIKACKNEVEVRYWEMLWSLKYSLPTGCFKERKNIAIKGIWLTKLYQQLDTEKNARRLALDLGIDLNSHHFCLDAVTRGQSRRIKINVNICQRNYRSKRKNNLLFNPKIVHEINLETSNQKIIKLLIDNGYKLQKSKKGYRIRIQKTEASEISTIAFNLQKLTKGIIENKFKIGFKNKKTHVALVMPASNILEGHYLPIINNNEIIFDEIISKKISYKKVTTYDLEINRTHNFIANDIVVHNSIYRFRGAAISNILDFTKTYADAKQIVLNQNYRSTQQILDASYKLIKHNNPDRLEVQNKIDKKLISQSHGQEPELLYSQTLSAEADSVTEQIKNLKLKNKNLRFNDFAILVRANSHGQPFIDSLNIKGIPHIFSGASGLYSQSEIKMLVAFLKCLVYTDDNLSYYQLATSELYNIDHQTMSELYTISKRTNKSISDLIKNQRNQFSEISEIYESINKYRQKKNESVGELLYEYLTEKKYLKNLIKNISVENELKIYNIAKFFGRITEFNHSSQERGVLAFLENLELVLSYGEEVVSSDIDPDIDAVNILTVHAAKGLEWPVVFIANCVADRFPSRNKHDPLPIPDELIKEKLPSGDFHLQEERRLFYVAATRTKNHLFLTSAEDYGGKRVKKLSQFVLELLDEVKPDKIKHHLSSIEKIEKFKKLELQIPKLPDKFTGDKIRLSRQQIDDYFTCPKKFYFAHIIKIPLLENHQLMYGVAIHEALNRYFTRKINTPAGGKRSELSQLLSDYQEAFKNVGFITVEHEKQRYQQGVETLTRFYSEDANDLQNPNKVEQSFEFEVNNTKINGRYDLVYKLHKITDKSVYPEYDRGAQYEIRDFKTSDVKTQKDADRRIKESTQMMMYALAWQKQYGVIPKTTLYFIESGLKGEIVYNQKDLEETKQMIMDVSSGIKQHDFTAKPERFSCQYCPYKDICPDKI
ncbi:MAG: hypothetical protein ACD_58C00287G0005 [uncultured bacterium]|nr:MAG: hypothetical protein ACD_58C00287G0005 [uncultured bacterium]